MGGLVLKIAPKERFLINGAVIENGPRRSCFSIMTPETNVLRQKDALHPKRADTPIGLLCYQLQLILTGDCEPGDTTVQALSQLENLTQIFPDIASRERLYLARSALAERNYYKAFRQLRALLPLEERLLQKGL